MRGFLQPRWSYALIPTLLLALLISACAQQAPTTPPQTFRGVTLPNTEVRALTSSHTGRDYDIYVRLPDEYAQSQAKKYPVVYVLDGQWDFKLLDSISGGLRYDNFTPDMIIVGITYSGDSPNYDALRAMDYTPTAVESLPGSGGAPQFFAFFKEELIPFVEANYRADPTKRVLLGSSFGGLFTLYALFTEPELFSGYVAASPAVPYGDSFAFNQEAAYAGKRHDLPVRLFISVGEEEDLAQPVKQFAQIVSGRGYSGLRIESRMIAGERHAGNKPESFNRGLRFVFEST